MKSSYTVLGIPGNASDDDIRTAYQTALQAFSRERLVEQPELVSKLDEVRTAYKVLMEPASRAAHDRKLAMQLRLQPESAPLRAAPDARPAWGFRLFVMGAVLVGALLAVGSHINEQRAQKRREQQAMEMQERESAEREALAAQQARDRAESERAMKARQDEYTERRLRQASEQSAAVAAVAMARQSAIQAQLLMQEKQAAQRAEWQARADERRQVQEAQMRLEADKRRIRELCYQNYRRYDC